MKKPASKEDTLIKITDREAFIEKVKNKVLDFYIVTFNNYKEFMDVYDASKLKASIVGFWIDQYSFMSDDGIRLMYSSDYEVLVGRVYKEYCQLMMNKLVDIGYLTLMWDNKKKIVVWKKPRYNGTHDYTRRKSV